ncbi:SAM-dependent methyltransferase [Candidatus Nitrosocosmicus franklandus]|uniref:Erythromycin 3''-O-methyltransferase n=1 Tax=Candidatus Nitrosocosmicus franklandianus TaxID=1798806 RepID=A0A484I4H7_9ARCH|nr:class I SAM-dependent methyltransferase [Candidatus Nitrosocosmicus franklandus]VFJ12666.1 Erythromycin 3''-O-methyltransferase [Candidatus Nitrosocosmicus franklandus]
MFRNISWVSAISIFRRGDSDIIRIYDIFSNLMKVTTGAKFLNLGFWNKEHDTPYQAQKRLTELLGEFGLFSFAHTILDVGSGYSLPAYTWLSKYPNIQVYCINSSFHQLKEANYACREVKNKSYYGIELVSISNLNQRIHHLNAISNLLPLRSNHFDRIVAFESAHHFRPLEIFVSDCSRLLKQNGLLILAIPVITSERSRICRFLDLGILNLTWASEHYTIRKVRFAIENNGFKIIETKFIGPKVYQSLANYYFNNLAELRTKIVQEYPSVVEWILRKSILRMKKASASGKIEYLLIKSTKK